MHGNKQYRGSRSNVLFSLSMRTFYVLFYLLRVTKTPRYHVVYQVCGKVKITEFVHSHAILLHGTAFIPKRSDKVCKTTAENCCVRKIRVCVFETQQQQQQQQKTRERRILLVLEIKSHG